MCEAENAPDQVFNTVDSFENKVIGTVDNASFYLIKSNENTTMKTLFY